MERITPYLGRYDHQDGTYVVLFEKEGDGCGMVVMSENPNVEFGTIGNFDESLFEVLDSNISVRLNN